MLLFLYCGQRASRFRVMKLTRLNIPIYRYIGKIQVKILARTIKEMVAFATDGHSE